MMFMVLTHSEVLGQCGLPSVGWDPASFECQVPFLASFLTTSIQGKSWWGML